MKLLASTLFYVVAALGQPQSTGAATTRSSCSPANTGNSNVFTINCGIGKEQGDQMLRILNTILAKQLDPNAVMVKLDEIENGINEIRKKSAPRIIGDPEAGRIVTRIKTFNGQKAELHQTAGDDETRQLMVRIRGILTGATWDPMIGGPVISFSNDGAPLKGIRIAVADVNSQAALVLLNALNDNGVSVEGNVDSSVAQDVVRIDIRPKPAQ